MSGLSVAFVIFNRPRWTRQSFAPIRAARPERLFLISDAARPDHSGEVDLVQQSRQIAEAVDWPCEVHRIYARENMGCARRVSSGIDTAFELVDDLVIVEDDCVADRTFFGFSERLLDRYRDDRRVMTISGTSYQHGIPRTDRSYYFSKYPHCWGWATWKRAWQHFSLAMSDWPEFRDLGLLRGYCGPASEIAYWTDIFDRVHRGEIDSWAYAWTYCCWRQHGLNAIPASNLVSNIGFGEDATHTRHANRRYANLPIQPIAGLADRQAGLAHPEVIVRHTEADAYTDDLLFSRSGRQGTLRRLMGSLSRLPRSA